MPDKSKRIYDSLFAAAENVDLSDEDRMKTYAKASYAVYKDLDYGYQVCQKYLQFAKEKNNMVHACQAIDNLGYVWMMRGNIAQARKMYNKGLSLAQEYEKRLKECSAYASLGNLMYHTGTLDSAIYFHSKSLEIALANDFKILESRAYLNIGSALSRKGQYDRGLKALLKAKSIIERKKVKGYYASLYIELGNVYRLIKEYKTAEEYLQKGLEAAESLYNHGKTIETLGHFGKLELDKANFSHALEYYQQGIEIAEEQKLTVRQADMETGIAEVYLKQKDFTKALEHITVAIAIKKGQKTNYALEDNLYLAGKILFEMKKFQESEQYLKEAYSIMKSVPNPEILRPTCQLLYQVNKQLNNNKEAFAYLEEYNALQSIYDDEQSVKDLISMSMKQEFQKEKLLDSLEVVNNKELTAARHLQDLENKNSRIIIIFIVAIILAIVLAVVLYFWKNKNKLSKELKLKNIEIEQSLKDKNVLLKELHHRVKNNMQIASSVLQLKAKNTKSKAAKEALLDSQLRLESMQMAHQKIFDSNDHERIDLVSYLKDLVQVLSDSLLDKTYSTSVKGTILIANIEQAQTLGFVIHEFITNSYKHSWENNEPNKSIEISIAQKDEYIELEYRDNGKGLPKDFAPSKSSGFGMKFIVSLVKRQLRGELKYESVSGTQLTIIFKQR